MQPWNDHACPVSPDMRDLMKLPVTVPHLCYSYNMPARKPKGIDWNGSLADFKDAVTKAVSQNPIVAQNVKYFNAAKKGPSTVIKTAASDAAWTIAGEGAARAIGGIGKAVGKVVAQNVAETSAQTTFKALTKNLPNASQGGKTFTTQTPFGPTLASTKIMTSPQREAAIKGLATAAGNRATEVGVELGSRAGNVVSSAIRETGRALGGAAAIAGIANTSKTSNAKKKNSGSQSKKK